ncbi:carboxypeptidase regulatory-like domain-containing protein [Bacillus benzoevorans]|uniref:Protocatechuate 3,4-dioxygenase beta subunit n=1 Tax=Bacillus benzoevorans TaxID=1456 RepID=A0A7X0LX49_9BACI|nr:carboxypeptidase regulatory-like domain-containing protein [Bacillus benzoevorans]MBB6446054.1 protocatechuate 3,4-dioxygenase beta subunit [Bacillus benzoevorans]
MTNSKSLRKFLTTAATATIVVGAASPIALAAGFEDVAPQYKEAVDFVTSKGITGFNATTFGTYDNIKRVDAAIMLVKVLGLDIESAPASGFTDVPDRAVKYINALKAAGITSGKTTTEFDAQSPIKRGELAIWIDRAFTKLQEKESNVVFNDVAPQYKEAVATLVKYGITSGTSANTFGTYDLAKRGDFARFLYKAAQESEKINPLASGISGFVMDNETPVVGAAVSIGSQTVKTDDKGYYTLLNIAPGKHEVKIEADGYVTTKTADVTVAADKVTSFSKDISSVLIDTDLIKISGVVVNAASSAAISGADVNLETFNTDKQEWKTVASVQTTANGGYEIAQKDADSKLDLGAEYRLTVSMDGYKDYVVPSVTLDGQKVDNVLEGIKLAAIAPMDITGTVTNAEGAKVNAADVKIYNADGKLVQSATTNAQGVYTIENAKLVTDTYNVVVDDKVSAVSNTDLAATEGTDAVHNVTLKAGHSITATIDTETVNGNFGTGSADEVVYKMELLQGNTVIATDEFKSEKDAADAVLTFDFARVANGDYSLRLSGDYVVTKTYSVGVTEDKAVEDRALEAGIITGKITAGAALNDAAVNLLDANGKVVAEAKTNADGSYMFVGLAAGKYKAEAVKNGLVTEKTAELTVTKNNATDAGTLDLKAVATTGDVAGYVRTAGTLKAVADATVTYYDADGEEVKQAKTDADGKYAITKVEPGNYKVVVRGTGVETYSDTQKVNAGDNLTAANYSMTAGGDATLKITVVDSEGNPVNAAANGFDLSDVFVDPTNPTVGVVEKADAAANTVTFTGLSAGTYNLAIDTASADFVDVKTTATVAAAEKAELKIVVDKVAAQSAVNFRVVDENNANVDGATVVIFKEDGTMKETHKTTNGTADLALIDGNYTLAVYHNGYLVSKHELTVAGKDITVPVIQLTKSQN